MHVMSEEDYKHTWVIPRHAWYIKFYLWLWMAKDSEITFCKLFWAYSLCWIALPIRLIIACVSGPIDALDHYLTDDVRLQKRAEKREARRKEFVRFSKEADLKREHRRNARAARRRARRERRAEKRLQRKLNPSFMQRRLSNVANAGSKAIMWFNKFDGELISERVFIGAAALGVGSVITAGTIYTVDHLAAVLSFLPILGLIVLGTGLFIGVVFLLTATAVGALLKILLWESTCKPLGQGVGKGALTFRQVMKIGYKSVKGNTCPRVVIGSVQNEE